MIKRQVLMPIELIENIAKIVHKEAYRALMDAFPSTDIKPPIFLSQAEALIDLAAIEKKKTRLMYPNYDDEQPEYNEIHEARFNDVLMGIYEKTVYYLESAFSKVFFDQRLR